MSVGSQEAGLGGGGRGISIILYRSSLQSKCILQCKWFGRWTDRDLRWVKKQFQGRGWWVKIGEGREKTINMQTSLMTPKCETSGKSKICSVKFWNTPLHYTICLLKRRKTSNSLRQTLRSHFTLLYQELMGHVWPVNTYISINVGVNLWLQEK